MSTTTQPAGPVDQLIGYITRRGMRVGDRLPSIKELAAEFNLGPHAVRDALLHAQMLGLVQVRPRSGAYVQSADFRPLVGALAKALPPSLAAADANLLDLLEARRVIESEMAAVAAGRRRFADLVPLRAALDEMYRTPADYPAYVRQNEAFHRGVAELAGNRVLLVVLDRFLELLRAVLLERRPADWAESDSRKRDTDQREHEAIFAALVAGDPAATRAAMLDHLRDTTDSLVPRPQLTPPG